MELYETNKAILEQANPEFAALMARGNDELHFEVFMEEESLLSLNLVHTQTFKPLYASKPQEYIAAQKGALITQELFSYLYFFGMGNGVLLKALLSNPVHKRIVVIEPDPQIAYVVFHLIDFSKELLEGRLVFLTSTQINFPTVTSLFKDFESQRCARLYDLHVMSDYYEAFQDLIQTTNHLFIEALHHNVVLAGNDTKDALLGLKHHITNLPLIPTTPPLYELFKKFNTTDVAVLVSTGPSLGKQLPLLKRIAPYVRIVAVDASLPILIQNSIVPDVVTSIERVPQSSRFFKAVPPESMKGIITVLSSLQHNEVIQSLEGQAKIISVRPLSYMRVIGPKEWGYIGIGMSAANMAYELIYHSGFKTCILIGQDLAYAQDGKSHAKGHVFGENEVKQNEFDGWVEAYGGQGKIKTTAVWNMFRGFFEKDIAEAKAKMLTINATEGGARIFGALELPFEKAAQTYVKKRAKSALSLDTLSVSAQQTILERSSKTVAEIEAYVHTQQKNVEALFLEVAKLCDGPHFLSADEALLRALLQRIEAYRESFKDEMFDKIIWHIAQTMLLVQEIALAPIEMRYVDDMDGKKAKYRDLLVVYKGWLFSLAGCLSAIVKTIIYAKARSLIYTVKTIDVMCGDTHIDTLTCKDMSAQKGRVFDVDMRGILYDVPERYRGEKISFRDGETKKVLPQEFVATIDQNDGQYNELRFIFSLTEPISPALKDFVSTDKSIGFIGVPENLEDKELIHYVKGLVHQIAGIKLHIFCFNTKQEDAAKKLFSDIQAKVEVFLVATVEEIVKHVNLCFFTHKAPLEYQIFTLLKENTKVAVIHFNTALKKMTIQSAISSHQNSAHPLLENPEFFGFSKAVVEASHNSVHKVLYEAFLGTINMDENLYEFTYNRLIEGLLSKPSLRNFYVDYTGAEWRYALLRK
jgi:hypothetical protein